MVTPIKTARSPTQQDNVTRHNTGTIQERLKEHHKEPNSIRHLQGMMKLWTEERMYPPTPQDQKDPLPMPQFQIPQETLSIGIKLQRSYYKQSDLSFLFEYVLFLFCISGPQGAEGRLMLRLTGCTQKVIHRWLCVCCRNGSPGQCESLLSGRPLPPSHSHRPALSAETPWEMWPASQRIWREKQVGRSLSQIQNILKWLRYVLWAAVNQSHTCQTQDSAV